MFERGIQTSVAHYWAHVCPLDGMIYWYGRRAMLNVMTRYRHVSIKTARGYTVPIRPNLMVNGGVICDDMEPDYPFMKRWDWDGAASDKEAGAMAEACFRAACQRGLMRLPVFVDHYYTDKPSQDAGKDFRCWLGAPKVDVEVKGDVLGGIWGTGNLFVQTHEGTRQDGDKHDADQRHGHRGGNGDGRAL